MSRAADGLPVPPRKVRPDIPVDLERVVQRMLSPDPALRYPNSHSLVEDLRRLCSRRAPEPSPPPVVFADRDEELAKTVEVLEEPPAVLAVSGEAGMGRTAFLRRVALEAELAGKTVLEARCYVEGAPLVPLREMVERWIPLGDAGRRLRKKYRLLFAEDRDEQTTLPADGARSDLLRGLVALILELSAREPSVILIDDLHLADSLTVESLMILAREIGTAKGGLGQSDRFPAVVLSYTSEIPAGTSLRALLDEIDLQKGDCTVALRGLSESDVERWIRRSLAGDPHENERVETARRLGGRPLAIQEMLRGGRTLAAGVRPENDLSSVYRSYTSTLDESVREALGLLAALSRPTSPEVLAELLSQPVTSLQALLARPVGDGMLRREGGLYFFPHSSFHSWLCGETEVPEKKLFHRRIASALEKTGGFSPEELAGHWLRSDEPVRGLDLAILAARQLVRKHAYRRALHFYEAARRLTRGPDVDLWRTISEETAEALALTGEMRRAGKILLELLESVPARTGEDLEIGRLHGRAGVFHHRAGQVGEAVTHLEKGLRLLSAAEGEEWLRERLRIQSELAEITSNRGDYERAEAICVRALGELRSNRTRDAAIRREEMVLIETRAHLKLRQFQYAEAIDLFEQSLAIGQKLGALREMVLILNNLGTLHIQRNRFDRALKCYRKAESFATRLGDDQGLASILSNVSVIHAKLGSAPAADEAARRAKRHELRCDSLRTRLVRLHCTGIVDLYLGRYGSGIETFRAAIALGEEIKDNLMRAFDHVFLAECHLFRGEIKAAHAALDRALDAGTAISRPLRAAVSARKGVLGALREESRAAKSACLETEKACDGTVPFLEAGNRLYLGWALRLLGQFDRAAEVLEKAHAFFAKARVPYGEIHTALELTLVDLGRARLAAAKKRIRALDARYTCGEGPLKNPMLSARLLLCRARCLLGDEKPSIEAVSSALGEAESFLVGRRLRELETFVRDVRRRLAQIRVSSEESSPAPPALVKEPSDTVAVVASFREAAVDLIESLEEQLGRERTSGLRRRLRDFEARVEEIQRAEEKKGSAPKAEFTTRSLLGRSRAIREVAQAVHQVASCPLPVLITGETGTGKEIVARAIHGESSRSAEAFLSVSCAALPQEILEAELFGYRKGAFSGAEKDHSGLLPSAHGGTFLFDEVGELPLPLQGKLLRVLDSGRVRPLGSDEETRVDVRYLFSSNRDIRELAEECRFRKDLFYRLGAFEIVVPPLRERLEDLPLLIDHFALEAGWKGDRLLFDEEALGVLARYPWPGNVRELRNVVTRIALMKAGETGIEELKGILQETPSRGVFTRSILRSRSLPELQAQLEKEFLLDLHRRTGGDLAAIAAQLGITRRALYARLKRLSIRPREIR